MSTADGNLIGEANLDFDLVMGLLDQSQKVLLYQIGDDDGVQVRHLEFVVKVV